MRKTKIVCTIGPASDSEETLAALCRAGMNVARLNFSHNTHADHQRRIDAIKRVPGAKSLDGVKRRTRAGMGRCQGGFCSPRVMEILAREMGVEQSQVTKAGGASQLIVGINKDKL